MKKKYLIVLLIILLGLLIALNIIYFKANRKNSNIILPYKYIGIEQNEYIAVSDGEKFGYVNSKTGKLTINLDYPLPESTKIDLSSLTFKEGLAPITNNGQYFGLIDSNGKTIIKPHYDSIKVIKKDLILVYKNSSYYFINSKEEKLFNLSFQNVQPLEENNNLFIILLDNKYGILNSNGDKLLDCKYDKIITTYDKITNNYIFSATSESTTENYYLKNNTLVKMTECDNLQINLYNNNYGYFTDTSGMYYIYNTSTDKLIKLTQQYIAIGPYINGIALAINQNMKVGYINQKEEEIIPFEYDFNSTSDFTKDGYATVEKNNLIGVIDTTGKEIIPIEYSEIQILAKNSFLVIKNNTTLLINSNQKNLLSKNYNTISIIENQPYLLVTESKNNNLLYGLIDYYGKEIIKPNYLNIKVYDNYFELQEKANKYIIKNK